MNWSERYSGKITKQHEQLVKNYLSDMNYASYPVEDGGEFTDTVDGHMNIHHTAKQHADILYAAQKKATGPARSYLWNHYLDAQNTANYAKKKAEQMAKPQLF